MKTLLSQVTGRLLETTRLRLPCRLLTRDEAVLKQSKSIARSLTVLSRWFNTTQGNAVATKLPTDIKVLVDLFGYTPHTGPVYRKFYTKAAKCPKVGAIVKIQTGLRPIQSWSGKLDAVSRFAGNKYNALTVELKSSEIELLNTRWLRTVLAKLNKIAERHKHKILLDAITDVRSTIRRGNAVDDEDEVIMLVENNLALVKVLHVVPAFKGGHATEH